MPKLDLDYRREYNKLEYVREAMLLRERRPERKRAVFNRHLIRSYDITFDDYTRMLMEQCGHCKLCNNPMMGLREPHVDHCHKTKKVRGLLCLSCNLLVATSKESVERLKLAIIYIKEHCGKEWKSAPEVLSYEY